MSHLLQSPWTFYIYQKKTRGHNNTNDYESCIHKIAKVTTVEEFWGVYSRIIPLNKLGSNAIHFFRGDSRAMWEDDDNINGGAFRIVLNKYHAPLKWENLLLDLIVEKLNYEFIGATITSKGEGFNLFIWNRTAVLDLTRSLSGEIFKSLDLAYKSTIKYTPHSRFVSTPGQDVKTTTYLLDTDGPITISDTK